MLQGIVNFTRYRLALKFSFLMILLTACGGGGSGGGGVQNPGSDPAISVSQLIDGPTSGLDFVSGAQSGITDSLGLYLYEINGTITFKVGDIVLGSADPTGKSLLTPIDMISGAVDETNQSVTNILRFLQTIDDDANHDNGIVITAAVRLLAANQTIDFDQSASAFEQDVNVQTVVASLTGATTVGVRPLLPAATALANFRQSMLFHRIGQYCGNYTGGDTGALDLKSDFQGNITGTGQSALVGAFTVAGTVDSQGSVSLVSSVSGVAVGTFAGTIDNNRDFSGTWSDTGGNSGSVAGSRSTINCNQLSGGDGGVSGALRIGYDIYNGLFRFEMENNGAPVDVLQPYTRVVTLQGTNASAEDDGTAWLPVTFTLPVVLDRVPFENRWINNASGMYQFSPLSSMFEPDTSPEDIRFKIFFSFLKVGLTSLTDTISIGDGTVTGSKVGTRSFDGKSCTIYDLSTQVGSAGQACLALFSGVNGAVVLYYKGTIIYTDPDGVTTDFDLIYVARKVETGLAVDSSTFTAP